jgi:hypothetical protein
MQIDLDATNPWLTCDSIWTESNFLVAAGALKIAPDSNIYFSSAWYDGINFNYPYPDTAFYPINSNLSVIEEPDSAGAACSFQPYSFSLGGQRTYWGLPNLPNYNLGPLPGSTCDSLTVGVQEPVYAAPDIQLNAWWHSDWQRLIINASGLKKNKATIITYDMQGRLLLQQEVSTMPPYLYYELNAATLSDGVYIVELREGNQTKAVKWVKR